MKLTSLILALCISACCCAKEYFVAVDGNDKWPGTKEKPFKTMGKAVSCVNPGDVVTVRGGVYRERVDFRRSGTPEKPIILRGAPGETALSTAAFPVPAPWKKTPGFRFIYESSFPYAISMMFDSVLINRYLEVEDMKLLDRQPGAFLLDKKSGKLYVNTFTGRDPNSINLMAVPWLGGNSDAGHGGGRTGNKLQPFSAKTDGLYQWNKGIIVYGSNIIIENFTFGFWPGQAVRVNSPAQNVIVRNNTVYGGTCGLMFYGDVKNCKILNNRVFRVAGTGIQLTGSGEKCLVKGNYVFNCGTCSPFKGAKDGSSGNVFNIAHYGSYRDTDIIDNTVVSTDPERCGRTLMRNKGAIRKFTTQTGNVFYGGGVSLYAAENSSALLANNTCFGGKISIGSLKTENKYEPVIKDNLFITDKKKDPKFADVHHRDFRLQTDSPHLGKGAFPKAGAVFYAGPNGTGDCSAAAKAGSLAAALKKLSGKEGVIYLLPGTYRGAAVISGNVKLANHEGGRVIMEKVAVSGKGKVTFDGIIFKNASVKLADTCITRRSVFDGSKVNAKELLLENSTFRNSAVSGRTILRNSFICGTGNTFSFAGMISENNFFNDKKALSAFTGKVKEVHKSSFAAVKLNQDYTLPRESRLNSAGLDCSVIGGQKAAEFKKQLLIEDLQVKQLSHSTALVSWSTPRHYCNVNVRIKLAPKGRESFAGSSNQGRLRSTGGEVLLRKLLPGKEYIINCHFYPIDGSPMMTRTLKFKNAAVFTHKPVTLQVDAKAPKAFRSIGEALRKAGPGDTILVSPGVYTEEVNIYLSGVTLKSRVPGKASINVAGLLNYAVKVAGVDNVTIDGFQFVGLPYSAAHKALLVVDSKNFVLRNCFFHRPESGKGVSNIQFLGHRLDGVLVENCIFDSGFHGIWLYPAKDVTIRNNSFYGNGVNAIHVGCEQGWKTQIYNNIFQDTVSNHHSPAVTVAEHGPHIYCDYNIYWKTSRAPKQCYYAFGRHQVNRTYSAPWTIKKKNQPETLKETQRRFGIEKHAIEADPLFADVAKADFTLKKGSPAFKKGKDGKNIGADFSIFK